MTYSLGEVEALCRKAARGAGFSWGMADEAGKTARWLCRQGLPGAAALAGYLDTEQKTTGPDDPSGSVWSASGPLCPLICGTLLSDLGAASVERRLHELACPILFLPHVGHHMTLSWDKVACCIYEDLHIEGDPMTPLASLATMTQAQKIEGTPCTPTTRAMLAPDVLSTLTRFAARTYAPETDASKLSGAGAGLTDED
ncbi:MAG: DUF3726 domain-containing protein [Pseudomonadota bacterium]